MNFVSRLGTYFFITTFSLISCVSLKSFGKEAELIYQQTIIEISNDKITESHFYEIRINKRDGDKYAEISIGFKKRNKVYDIEAAVFDKNGKEIRRLRKSDIIERSALSDISFHSDLFVKEFSLRHNEYPYTLKYSYKSQSDQFLVIADWVPILDIGIPTAKAGLYLTTPANYKLSYCFNNINKCKVDSTSDQKSYAWEASFSGDYKTEIFSPPMSYFIPEVRVVPEHFYYEEEGFNRNWVDVGNWDQKLIKGLSDLPENEKEKLRQKVKDCTDTVDKIRTLFHYLQDETRYVNVSIKTGGHKPYPASYVAKNKYGDCKALANYFIACLQEVNVKAYYSLIYADDIIEDMRTDFPSQHFNHVILFVPLLTDTLWLDCTSDMAFGYLGTFTQKRYSLVTEPGASKLYMTPALTFNDVLEKRAITANLTADGIVNTDVSCMYRGSKYEMLFYLQSNYKNAEKQEYLNRYLVDTGFELDTFNLHLPDRDSAFINFEYHATSGHQIKIYGNESLLKMAELEVPRLELPISRKLPLQINYPVYRADTLVYEVADNYKIQSIPENLYVNTKFGEYKTEFRIENKKVHVYKTLKIFAGSYIKEEYNQFYRFINQIRETEDSNYIILTNM